MKISEREYKNGKKTRQYFLSARETGGKPIRRCGFSSKSEAQEAAIKHLNEIRLANGTMKIELQKATFNDLFAIFDKKTATYSDGTRSNYLGLYNNHLQSFKDKKLDEITPLFLENWKNEMIKNEISPYVLNNCIKLINAIFSYAQSLRLIPRDYFYPIKKVKEPKKIRNRFDIETLKFVIQTCKSELPDFYPVFILATCCGMRLGEYSAITINDIDFANGKINICKQYTKRKLKEKPKTNESIRQKDVPCFIIDILKEHIERNNIEKGLIFKAIRPNKNTLKSNNGKEIPISDNWIRDKFKHLLEICGYDKNYMRLHDLRGEYVDISRIAGMSMSYISKQVGHARTSTTENSYSQIFETEGDIAKARFQEIFKGVV